MSSISVRSIGQVVAPRRAATASSRADGRPANSRVWVGASASAMASPMPLLAPVIIADPIFRHSSSSLRSASSPAGGMFETLPTCAQRFRAAE